MKALVIGGTGPTGPYMVAGLLARGYEVSILHRGNHEIPEIPPEVEHIHADPHFSETLLPALKGRRFDLVIATYGRLKLIAEALVGKTDQLLSIGGVFAYRGASSPGDCFPSGMPVPASEKDPLVGVGKAYGFDGLIRAAEEAVFEQDRLGHYRATHFRYPYVYGPRQLVPKEWSLIRRIMDGRKTIALPDGGLSLCSHGYAENLAHAVLLAVDNPERAAGRVFNAADDQIFTLRQWAESIAQHMGVEVDYVSLPTEIAPTAFPLLQFTSSHHRVVSTELIRSELGYRDLVPVATAIGQTVDWLLANPPEKGGKIEQQSLRDQFDYEREDRLFERLSRFNRDLAGVGLAPEAAAESRIHPYPHPKQAGELQDHRGR